MDLKSIYLLGRCSSGAQLEIMVIAPFIMPEAPNPATARPTINILDETAAPHRTEPTSKMAKKTRKDHYLVINVNQNNVWECTSLYTDL